MCICCWFTDSQNDWLRDARTDSNHLPQSPPQQRRDSHLLNARLLRQLRLQPAALPKPPLQHRSRQPFDLLRGERGRHNVGHAAARPLSRSRLLHHRRPATAHKQGGRKGQKHQRRAEATADRGDAVGDGLQSLRFPLSDGDFLRLLAALCGLRAREDGFGLSLAADGRAAGNRIGSGVLLRVEGSLTPGSGGAAVLLQAEALQSAVRSAVPDLPLRSHGLPVSRLHSNNRS